MEHDYCFCDLSMYENQALCVLGDNSFHDYAQMYFPVMYQFYAYIPVPCYQILVPFYQPQVQCFEQSQFKTELIKENNQEHNIADCDKKSQPAPCKKDSDFNENCKTQIATNVEKENTPLSNLQEEVLIKKSLLNDVLNSKESKESFQTLENLLYEKKQNAENCKKTEYVCNWKSKKMEICGKKFPQKSNFLDHINIHLDNKPYKCTIENCEKSFVQNGNLTRHIINIHNHYKRYECNNCNSSFSEKGSVLEHINKNVCKASKSDNVTYIDHGIYEKE